MPGATARIYHVQILVFGNIAVYGAHSSMPHYKGEKQKMPSHCNVIADIKGRAIEPKPQFGGEVRVYYDLSSITIRIKDYPHYIV
jgi:hypothetical protein